MKWGKTNVDAKLVICGHHIETPDPIELLLIPTGKRNAMSHEAINRYPQQRLAVTNDLNRGFLDAVPEVCGMLWEIEQFRREIKHLTVIERKQCRTARIQRSRGVLRKSYF